MRGFASDFGPYYSHSPRRRAAVRDRKPGGASDEFPPIPREDVLPVMSGIDVGGLRRRVPLLTLRRVQGVRAGAAAGRLSVR